jgi:regulatory protein
VRGRAPEPPEDRDTGPAADPYEVARSILLAQLTAGPRTRAQLGVALARRGVPDGVAATLLDRFTEVGLVDDAAFAQAWVSTRHSARGLSRRALRHELTARGVEPTVVEGALAEVDGEAEEAAARQLAERRMAGSTALDPAVRMRRTVAALARRGYSPGLAAAAARHALARYPSVAPAGAVGPEGFPPAAGCDGLGALDGLEGEDWQDGELDRA